MDLKGFVDRAKEAAKTAAQKAQEAANAISAAASASAAAPAPESAPTDKAPVFDGEDPSEATELALSEGVTLGEQAGALPANPAPAKSFSTLANEKLNELSAV